MVRQPKTTRSPRGGTLLVLALILAASSALGGCANSNTGAGVSEESPRPAPTAPRYTRLPVR